MQVWRINVGTRTLVEEDIPPSWEYLGGRGLIARILLDEVPPECDPLGPLNKLIFTPGLLVGHMLSSCDRLSIGGKSPLTGTVKESNSGGTTGMQLALLGIRAMIVEGVPADQSFAVLVVTPDSIRFDSAEGLTGKGVYDTASILRQRYLNPPALSIIGPAGEVGMLSAGILNLDQDQNPSRINGRGGLGALMGVKKIKAIVWQAEQAEKPPIIAPEAFHEAQRVYTQALLTQPQTAVYRDYGTAGMLAMSNGFDGLPTRGFSQGQFEEADKISGETLRDTLLQRGGISIPTHACMPGCVIRCSNRMGDENGNLLVSPLEYETIGLMGSNLGISDLDCIARLNWEANDIGVDSIDTGAALGVAARAGLLNFSDGNQALVLMDEIRRNTPLGRILGNGAGLAGRILGVREVPVVKNQALSAYDPRTIKGTGVTYATSPQGADHTAGLTIRAKVDHQDSAGQAELSRKMQINMAGYDTLGACTFAGSGFAAAPTVIRDLLNARYGWQVGDNILQELGMETLRLEREFNRRAGFTAADDRLPEWMTQQSLETPRSLFDVPPSDLDNVFNF